MADYCTVAEVQVYLTENITLSADSDPSSTQVGSMITDTSENIIDSTLSRYITIPVTDAQGLKYLKQWAIYCVLSQIYRALESEPDLSTIYDNKCQGMKNAFMSDPGLVSEPYSEPTSGITKGSTRPPIVWKKDEVQW